MLTSHVLPVALPGPDEQSPAKGATGVPRPVIGPVVPLSTIGSGEGGDLLGAVSHPAEREALLATRVLNRGDAIVAPPGRADDFSWPRADTNASGALDVGPAPDAEDGIKNDANKSETKRSSDAKNQPPHSIMPPTPHVTAAKPRRLGDQLDGPPRRTPLPVGPAASNSR